MLLRSSDAPEEVDAVLTPILLSFFHVALNDSSEGVVTNAESILEQVIVYLDR